MPQYIFFMKFLVSVFQEIRISGTRSWDEKEETELSAVCGHEDRIIDNKGFRLPLKAGAGCLSALILFSYSSSIVYVSGRVLNFIEN